MNFSRNTINPEHIGDMTCLLGPRMPGLVIVGLWAEERSEANFSQNMWH